MSAEARIGLGCLVIGKASAAQDSSDTDADLKTLLAKSKALQLVDTVALCRAVQSRVFEDDTTSVAVIHCRRSIAMATVVFWAEDFRAVLEDPDIATLVVQQAWVIVAFVQILENSGEDLWFLVDKCDALCVGLEELVSADIREERGFAENVFVSSEQSLVLANDNRDDCAVQARR